jgi:hypothetical protein
VQDARVVLIERRTRAATLAAGTDGDDFQEQQQRALLAATLDGARVPHPLPLSRAISAIASTPAPGLPSVVLNPDAELEATLVDAVFAEESWLDALAAL